MNITSKILDERLSAWAEFRSTLSSQSNPLQATIDFWRPIKLTVFNHAVDPYNHKKWPRPWDIIANNVYDDLTLAIMLAHTLKLSECYKQSKISIHIAVDSINNRLYNLVYIDDHTVLNYTDTPVSVDDIPKYFYYENTVEIDSQK